MPRKIFIVFFVLLFSGIALKTFFFNKPISPEKVVISYLQLEQFGTRESAEKFLSPNLNDIKILEKSYEKLRKEPHFQRYSSAEFELKEIKKEGDYQKVVITEKVANEAYFFNFLLSREYQKDGEIEFEAYLKKEGDWWHGYQWKIVKIDSSTLIQWAKIGEEKEIKTDVFATTNNLTTNNLQQKVLKIHFKNNSDKDYKASYSDWKVVDNLQKEYISSSIKTFFLEKGKEDEQEISFNLPKNFILKEILFRNEGREIHWR